MHQKDPCSSWAVGIIILLCLSSKSVPHLVCPRDRQIPKATLKGKAQSLPASAFVSCVTVAVHWGPKEGAEVEVTKPGQLTPALGKEMSEVLPPFAGHQHQFCFNEWELRRFWKCIQLGKKRQITKRDEQDRRSLVFWASDCSTLPAAPGR